MSICGQNAVFHGHTYTRLCDSGFQSLREHTIYSMDTQWNNPELTSSTPNSHLGGMSDHQRPLIGPHSMTSLPVLDHWPSPPIAHSHHINNSSNGNMNAISNNNNNNSIGPCIQNQCNITSDIESSSIIDNNNSSVLMKNGDCTVNNDNNNKSNSNNSNDITKQSDGDSSTPSTRQNHLGTVILHGVAIVSLIIDNKERLCLAQISNTLLKEYSYNEIHNRRVALGITCVQCTPVQLEILRRAGAMPVSSRRCGMITKREAERLVKSFLEDNAPPKLPEDFAFDVIHNCGWGCRGLFEPARYNSSRAKCIKCMYCSMYFSPNKFIFHFHRTPGAKYNHPDAANFNSWRRHLKLYQAGEKDEITFKWEDVKAMFNGGTRKKIGSSASSSSSSTNSSSSSLSSSKFSPHLSSSHHPSHHHSANTRSSSYQHNPSTLDGASPAKKAKTSSMMDTNSFLPKPAPFSNLFNPYGWLTATHNKAATYPFMTMNSAQSMCFGFPPQIPANKDTLMDRMKSAPVGVGNPTGWMNRNPVAPFQLASMDLLWDKTFGFPSAAVAALGGFRNGAYPNSIFPGAPNPMGMEMSEHLSPPRENIPCISPNSGIPHKMASPGCHDRSEKAGSRMSAFTRVVPSMSPPSSVSLSPQNSNADRNTPSRNDDDDDETDNNAENDGNFRHTHDTKCMKTENGQSNLFGCDFSTHRDVDDSEEIDVEEDSDDKKRLKCSITAASHHRDMCQGQTCNTIQSIPVSQPHAYSQHNLPEEGRSLHPGHHPSVVSPPLGLARRSVSPSARSDDECGRVHENRSPGHESAVSDESDTERDHHSDPRDTSKDDTLCEDKTDTDDRKKEEEMKGLKDPYREDANREKSFQEHMSKQLEMLRETLTTELEQERKIRYSLQEKLKQAHEALNSFSCGLLTTGSDPNPFKDAGAVPR